MKIQIKKATHFETEEVEVVFPLYSYNDAGDFGYDLEYFTRIDESLKKVTIHKMTTSYGRVIWGLQIEQLKAIHGHDVQRNHYEQLAESDWLEVLAEYKKVVEAL